MPSRIATMKRNAPADLDKSDRPSKMLRGGHTGASVHALEAAAPIPAPATAPSPGEGALKRKRDATENFAASKKARLDTNFDGAGITTTSPTGCRRGKARRRFRKAVNVNMNSDDDKEAATTGNTGSPFAGEDTVEVSASTEGDAAAASSEPAIEAKNETEAQADSDTAEVPASTKRDAEAMTSECAVEAERNNDDESTGNTSSHSARQDTAEVSVLIEKDAAVTASEDVVEAENDCNNSSEPTCSSRKSVSGFVETADISDSSSESASSLQKPVNGSSETLDTIVTVYEPGEAPKKTTRMAKKKSRYINGLLNNGNQCFANATLQFFDAAMDGHDLDLVLGKDASTPFEDPDLNLNDMEDLDPTKKGEKPKSRLSMFKASIRDLIWESRAGGMLKDISPRKHLRALLNRMRGPRDTGQPKWLTPIVFQQILAFGGESALFEHLDGTTQEDPYEYFDALLSGVTCTAIEEPNAVPEDDAESVATLESIFEIKSEEATVCSNPSCDHKDAVRAETSNAISVPIWESKRKLELMDLLEASNTSTLEGMECSKCGEETLARVTELKDVGDNLVVHINRVIPGYENKLTTAVELPLKPITICGREFVLNAVVRHKGYHVTGGHYTVLRRRSPEWLTDTKSLWYSIDDESIKDIKTSDVKDHGRYGHSAMLLFKAL